MTDGVSDTDDDHHPLRAVGRALTGAGCTEVGTCAVVLALVTSLGGVIAPAGVALSLAHAAGLWLGAAAALLAADGAARRWGWGAGLVVGLLLAPLAPLGGVYALGLRETFDVAESTNRALSALRDAPLDDAAWLYGFALLGYAPALVTRWRGWRVVDQVVAGALGLFVLGAVSLSRSADVPAGLPTAGSAALLLARAVALPVGLALGDGLAAFALRRLRGDDPVSRPSRRLPPSLVIARAALLLPLGGVVAVAVGAAPFEPPWVTVARLGAVGDGERLQVAERLLDVGVAHAEPPARNRTLRGPGGLLVVTTGTAWGHVEVALGATEEPPELPLHASFVACLEGPAARGDVDAMILLGILLQVGTERRQVTTWSGNRRWVWSPDPAEQAAGVAWARRALTASLPDATPLLPARPPSYRWDADTSPGPLVEALERESTDEALRFARLVAARHRLGRAAHSALLLRRPALRGPLDDPWVAPLPQQLGRVPAATSGFAGLDPVVPASIVPSGSPAADALASAALAVWPHGPDVARTLAIAALAWREAHREACLLLAAWHLRAACQGELSFGHVEVAESYLAPIEVRFADDVAVLANTGLCAAVRARLDPTFDRGWARRALVRLVAAAHLDPANGRAAAAREQATRALAGAGLASPTPGEAIGAVAATEERLAAMAAARRDGAQARQHAASANRLRARAGR